MAVSNTAESNGQPNEFRVILFGPQVTHWTRESLSNLQSVLLQGGSVDFLTRTLAELPSLWPLLEKDYGSQCDFLDAENLKALSEFARGAGDLSPQSLTNTQIAPLTVVSQIVDFIQASDSQGKKRSLPSFQAAQGFCIGFLSAAALASAKEWAEFETNICNAVRLAACIGIIVDVQEMSLDAQDRAAAISVRWKTAADRAYLETCLDLFPEAYVSCITDESTLTITLRQSTQAAFRARMGEAKLATSTVGLHGSYHHSIHDQAAETLGRICAQNSGLLGLPDASKLQLPLRSTADAGLITSGPLHETALQLILCRRAHWFQTVKLTMGDVLYDRIAFVPVGREHVIPRSLKRGISAGSDDRDDAVASDVFEEIAVVGMACRFPRAENITAFWELLRKGETAFGKLPPERFHPADLNREPKLVNFWGNFLNRVDVFDHRFFSVSGREAKSMDPQQRLALQVAYEALESSGYCSTATPETDVGCYLGVGAVEYEDNVASESANAFAAVGTLRAFISGRISHFFGWTGPSITFDTACSSSAVAIHTACKAVLSGECAIAIAGGVNVITSPTLHQNLAAASFLNPNGSSKAFDATAGGYCRGEGAGILVLKKLSRALADGDTVLGVIAASAVNQGSNCSSISVPDSGSQSSLYGRVLSDALIEPEEVGYVEAHGTGTPVGDPVEYESVRLALTGSGRDGDLLLGSVKDNIGHTEAASGVAGVIKVLLMMQYKTVPKQANFISLNPLIKASSEIIVPKTTRPWTASGEHVALVNNYGAAGSNAALLLRSHAEASLGSKEYQVRSSAIYPVLLSAKTASHLQAYTDALKSYLPKVEASFGSVAYKISRSHNLSFEHRLAFTATDAETAVSILNSSSTTMLETATRTTRLPIVLCFGGQTGQTVRISKELYDSCHPFRYHLDKCDAVCQTLGLPSIFPGIFQGDAIKDLVSLHCMLLSLQVSSAKCWIDCGLEVDTLIGHSFGQLAALCVADSISLEDTFRLVSGRARLIRDSWGLEGGVMLSVECNKSEIEAVVEAVNKSRLRVDVACYNGPRNFVLAGDAPSIESAKDECRPFKTAGLQNTHAYHSYLADGILQDLAKVAGSITIRPPRLRVETCSANGSWPRFTAEEVVQHTRRPVYFGDAVERIAARLPSAIWLEAGSTTPVIAMARRVINKPDRSDVFIPMELGIADAPSNLAKATCQLWKAGSAAQYWLFHSGPSVRRHYQLVNLPPYQFDKPSHWIQLKIPTRSEQPKEVGLVTMMSNTASGELLFSVDTANAVFELAGRGHAVTGQSLCPASMYMELAILAARSAANTATTHATEILPHVEGLVILAPLGLGAGISVFLRLRQTAQDSWDFTLFSRSTVSGPVEDGGTEHARGRISWGSADDTMADRGVKLLQRFGAQGIRRLSSLAATGISGAMVYKLFSEVVAYADYYRGVQSVSASGNEAIGLVTVPAQFSKASAGICDPIILDNFLQVAGIHVNCLSQRDDDQVFMCSAVEEVIFTTHFMTSRGDSRAWSVYTRYEASFKAEIANDIFVCDASSGKLVLAVLGATFRSVPFKSLARSLTRLNKVSTIVPTSLSAPIHDRDGDDVLEDSAYQRGSSSSPGGDGETNFKKHVELYLDPAPLFQPLVGQPTKKSSGSSNVLQQIRNLFSAILEIPVEEIQPTSTLDDLGVDSLLVTEILSEVQSRFKATISQSEFLGCTDVFSVARLIEPDQPVESTKKPSEPSLNGVASPDKLTNGMSHASSDKTGNKGPNLAVVSRECFVAAKPSYDSHGRTTGFSGFYSEAFPLQSELVVRYVVEAFATLGCNVQAMQPGDEVPIIPFEPRHKKLIPQLYKLLEDGGLVTKETDGAFRRTKTPVPTTPAVTLHQDMLVKFPKHASETKLLHTTGHRLADCLSGAADPIALIFQNSAARALLEDVYTNAPMFKTGTLLLGQYLSSVLERLGGRRELKILELGAGTGGTSKYIIETLAALRYKFSYTFTDLSSSLVVAAKRKFAKWPFMQYTTMDIEKEPAAEFLGNYDVVLSTNCIHATKDLVVSATNIRKMLRPDGILCLVELTRNLYWFDLVFGLLEGWWLFNDGREHALAHEGRWDQSLHTAGFDWVDWSTSPSPESDILRVVTASQYKLEPTNVDSGLGQANKTETDNHLSTKQTVAFKEVDGLQLQADIYYPPAVVDPSKRLPIALMIHGGGHVMLSRNDIRLEQTRMLLRNGFLPISIDYRLCPEKTLLEGPMADVADALSWARTVLPRITLARPDIAVDADRIVAVGWSTGGHLAMTLSWTTLRRQIQPPSAILAFYCPTDYEDPFWAAPNVPAGAGSSSTYDLDEDTWAGVQDAPITSYNVPSRKRALGGWLAPSDARSRLALHMNVHGRTLHVLLGGLDKNKRAQPTAPSPGDVAAASPLAQIRAGLYSTPTFLLHPREDDLIPWQQAERTWKALRTNRVDAELRIVEDVPHLFDLDPRHRGHEAAMRAVGEGYAFLSSHVGMDWTG